MSELAKLKRRVAALEKALAFYADPDSYYATSFLFDPPCGGFRGDFSKVPWSDYDRKMPGKLARRALGERLGEALNAYRLKP